MGNIISRSNAEALIPVEYSNEIIKEVSRESSALTLMKKLPNMTRKQKSIPVLQSLPVAGFVNGDNGLKAVSNVEWGNKVITAEEIAVIIPIPEAVLDDADYDIWAEIKPSIISEFGRVIDAAVFFGTDKPSTWPAGIVTGALTNSKTVALGTGDDIADDINSVMSLVEGSGFDVNGFAGEIGIKASLRGLRDQNGGLIFQPSLQAETPSTIYAQPISYVKNGSWDGTSAKLIAGDWTKAVYSIRQDITYKLLDQAVISDAQGNIIHNLAQQDMVALRCVMRLGWQLPNPVTQIGGSSRYPFAVLTPAAAAGGGT